MILGHREWCGSSVSCWHLHQFAPQHFRTHCACCGTMHAQHKQELCTPQKRWQLRMACCYAFLVCLFCLLHRSPYEVPDLLGKLNPANLFRPMGLGFCSEHSCKGQAAACSLPRILAEAEVLFPERLSTVSFQQQICLYEGGREFWLRFFSPWTFSLTKYVFSPLRCGLS